MRSAIVAEANVNVTDEEAVQKHMQYVEFDYTTSSDSSDSSDTTVSDDEKKQVKGKLRHLQREQRRRKICILCNRTGNRSKDATFDSDSVSPSKEVVKQQTNWEKVSLRVWLKAIPHAMWQKLQASMMKQPQRPRNSPCSRRNRINTIKKY